MHQLVWVCVEIKVLKEAGCKFTQRGNCGLVDCPHALVHVVVGAGAGTEGLQCPESCSLPVLVVMGKTREVRHVTCVVL